MFRLQLECFPNAANYRVSAQDVITLVRVQVKPRKGWSLGIGPESNSRQINGFRHQMRAWRHSVQGLSSGLAQTMDTFVAQLFQRNQRMTSCSRARKTRGFQGSWQLRKAFQSRLDSPIGRGTLLQQRSQRTRKHEILRHSEQATPHASTYGKCCQNIFLQKQNDSYNI